MDLTKLLRTTASAAMLGALLSSQAKAVVPTASPGIVTMTATLNDFAGSTSSTSGQRHDVVIWVSKADGTFIKTLWKQGDASFDPTGVIGDWDHFNAWNTARAGSTALDGFTGATSQTYAATYPNNPISVTWNCRDASNNLVEDGDYKFFIQYAENKTIGGLPEQGPVANGLTWTKGPASQSLTPPNEGTYGVTAPVVNNFTNMSINWIYATVPPTFTSSPPPSSGSMGTAYNHTCTTTGSAPITYSVTSGALPTGLTMTSAGVISGVPTVAGNFTGTITADNGVPSSAAQPFDITIAQAIVFTSAAPPANGNLANTYSHTCTVIGTAPVTFTVSSGALPDGLTLSPAGAISGTPTKIGTYTGKIQAHNGIAADVTQDFSILISPASAGSVTLTATISDYTAATSIPAQHDAVVWVTNAAGKFIKTLWKQGPTSYTHKDWTDHFTAWTTSRNGSEVFDGFTSATATTYVAPNNPVTVTWNCLDASGKLVDDGDYKFFIQYGENKSVSGVSEQGPLTSGLTWTKGVRSGSVNPPAEGNQGAPVLGNNFTGMSIVWTSSVVLAPEIVVEQPAGTGLVDGTASVDFGTEEVGDTGVASTFTIRNIGNDDLTGLAITTDGANDGDFVVSDPGATTLAAGASTTFTVAFKPTGEGSRVVNLHIASNDADENPFDIGLTGTATAPPHAEIVVQQPVDTDLVNGTSSRDFGSVNVGASGEALTFTIRSNGTLDLTGLAITKDGANAADFVVSDPGATTLPAGISTTFTVTFAPGGAGPRAAVIHIASNDTDDNPFDVQLTGTATLAPHAEIVVQQPVDTDLVNGTASKDFGSVKVGLTGEAVTFTIKSTGTADLTGLAITKDGANAADFVVSDPGATTLTPGTSTTFTVMFAPGAIGARVAAIHIASNDLTDNPFDIALAGTASPPPAPEIVITGPLLADLRDGIATRAFGKVLVGETGMVKTFTIKNSGDANLTGLSITLDGANPDDYVVTGPVATMLAPGESTTFDIAFKPATDGKKSATLHILSNDSDESSFDIQLTGTAVTPEPEIVVENPIGSGLRDGIAKRSFGTVTVGKYSFSKVITVKNVGGADLTDLAITKDGAQASDFLTTALGKKTLAPGESTTFKITFKPGDVGTRNAAIHIKSNDANENPFDISVTGMGVK